MAELYDCRDAFARALVELGDCDERVVAAVNDCVGSARVDSFGERHPNRLFNIGIAEQNLVGIGAGLANGGKIPFIASASCFLTGRAMEQIKADVAYSNANVKLVGMSSGVAYGPLGATHHSIEDLAWTRAIANLDVVVPSDPEETYQATLAAASHTGPVFLRLSRMPVPQLHDADYRFAWGRADQLRDGKDLAIIANGVMVSRALEAADSLAEQGLSARVINLHTLRPLDTEAIVRAARETGRIVTVEEHTVHGGLGGAVAEVVSQQHPVPMRILGIPDTFAPTGSAAWILEQFDLTAQGIHAAAVALAER